MKSLRQDKDNQQSNLPKTNWKPLYDEWLDVGHKIVANSFRSPKGTMKHFGSGNAPLDPGWDAYSSKLQVNLLVVLQRHQRQICILEVNTSV